MAEQDSSLEYLNDGLVFEVGPDGSYLSPPADGFGVGSSGYGSGFSGSSGYGSGSSGFGSGFGSGSGAAPPFL